MTRTKTLVPDPDGGPIKLPTFPPPAPEFGAKKLSEWEAEEAAAARAKQADNSTANSTTERAAPGKPVAMFMQVKLASVHPSDFNPRTEFDESGLQELADSIKEHGLMEPLVLWQRDPDTSGPVTSDGPFIVIAGERRFRASKLAGLASVPAMVHRQITRAQAIALALTENLVRRDINAMEMARGIKLLTDAGHTQQEIAKMINRSQPVVANTLGLLQLPEDVQTRIAKGELSAAHGQALRKYTGLPKFISAAAQFAVETKMTAGKLESDPVHELWFMQNKGHVIRLGMTYGDNPTHFDWKAVCVENCPHGAYRDGWCLYPEHFRELNKEAQEANARRLQEEAKDGKTIPRLTGPSALKTAEYELIPSKPPAGCTDACPCRSPAIRHDYQGNEVPVAICNDPGRFKKLEAADQRERVKAKRDAAQEILDNVTARVDSPPSPVSVDRSLLLILAVRTIVSCDGVPAAAAAARHGFTDIADKEHKWVSSYYTDKLLKTLASRDLVAITKMAAEAVMRKEIKDDFAWGGSMDVTAWFLKQPIPSPGAVKWAADGPATAIPTAATDLEELRVLADKHQEAQRKIAQLHQQLNDARGAWEALKIRHDRAHKKNHELRQSIWNTSDSNVEDPRDALIQQLTSELAELRSELEEARQPPDDRPDPTLADIPRPQQPVSTGAKAMNFARQLELMNHREDRLPIIQTSQEPAP